MRIFLVVLSLLLAACSQSQVNDTLATPQEKSVAVRFIAAVQSGDLASVRASVEPKLYAQTLAIARSLQPGVPKAANYKLVTVAVQTSTVDGTSQSLKALNYEFGAGNTWAVAQIVEKDTPGGPQIVGWHAAVSQHQPTTRGEFTLAGKSALHYFWLLAMVLSTGTIVAALILIGRSPDVQRRWLWAIGSSLGLGQFTLNWMTGDWAVRPLGFFLLGSAAFRPSPFDPWMLSFSLPIVAVIFLLRRKALMARPDDTSFD